MTPPKKITGQSEGIYNQTAGLCEAKPEPLAQAPEVSGPVCSATQYSPARLLKIDLGTRYASLNRNHVVARDSKLIAQAAQGSDARSESLSEVISGLATCVQSLGTACATACGNSEDLQDSPADEPIHIPTENNPPIPGEHDGVGSVQSNFATSQCADPASLFKSYSDNSLLLVCADAEGPGANIVESVDPATSVVSSITIPNTVPNISDLTGDKPVALSAGATHEGTKLVFAGLTPLGTDTEFASDIYIYRNSGIYTVDAAGQNPQLTRFKALAKLLSDNSVDRIGLINPQDGTQAGSRYNFDPNTPVSMVVDGDTLYALNMNIATDSRGNFSQMLAPASIHAFTIGQGGLTPTTFGSMHLQADQDISDGEALILDGKYNPAAIANVGDGRLAVLIRGLQGDGASQIIVLEIADPSVQKTITLADSMASFYAADSSQLAIVKLNNVNYALVGAGDESGRVAMVNLDAKEPAPNYVGVFGEGHNVVSVVVDDASSQAIAVSDQRRVTSLNLNEIDPSTGLPTVGATHDLPADARVAAVRGDSLIVAHPNKYSKVSVTAAPVSE